MNDSSTVTSESTPTSIHRNTLIARVFLDAKIVFPASVSATLPRNPLCIEWERISLRFYQSYNTRSCFELLLIGFRHLNFVLGFLFLLSLYLLYPLTLVFWAENLQISFLQLYWWWLLIFQLILFPHIYPCWTSDFDINNMMLYNPIVRNTRVWRSIFFSYPISNNVFLDIGYLFLSWEKHNVRSLCYKD